MRHLTVPADSLQPGDTIIDPFIDDERAAEIIETHYYRGAATHMGTRGTVTLRTATWVQPFHPDDLVTLLDESDDLREQIDVLTAERDAALAKVEDVLAEHGIKVDF